MLELSRGGTLLGTLYPRDAEMFWSVYEFEATPAFEEVRPLFEAELGVVEAEGEFGVGAWEEIWERILDLGVRLVPPDGGDEISEFALHVYGNGEARLRY